jgi:uncharacterized protein (DUF433 family)
MVAVRSVNYIEGSTVTHARIIGRGVKVEVIAVMYVYNHQTIDWIADNFDLTPAQIHAALAYYYDHRAEFDRDIEKGERLAEEIGTPMTELIEKAKRRLDES